MLDIAGAASGDEAFYAFYCDIFLAVENLALLLQNPYNIDLWPGFHCPRFMSLSCCGRVAELNSYPGKCRIPLGTGDPPMLIGSLEQRARSSRARGDRLGLTSCR